MIMAINKKQIDYLNTISLFLIFISFFFEWQTSVSNDYPFPSDIAIWENGLSSFLGVISILFTLLILFLIFFKEVEERIFINLIYIFIGLNILNIVLYLFGVVNAQRLQIWQKNYLGLGFYFYCIMILIYSTIVLIWKNQQQKK
jgi:hypothetical protein